MNSIPINKHITALVLILYALPVQAESASAQALERKLQLRDNTILELLERIEALEKRVGVVRQPTQSPETEDIEADSAVDNTQAPGAVVVEQGAAERALDRSLTQAGAILLSKGVLEMELSIGYSRREDSSPGFVTTNSQILASEIERNTINQVTSLALRLGLPWDAQLEIGIPHQRRKIESITNIAFVPTETSAQADSGTGDWRVGFAKTLLREDLWIPDLVGRITWDSDSGDTGGFEELRASLSATKRQDPLTFVGGLSYEESKEADGIKPGSASSINFGSYLALSPETSLRFLLAATRQQETELSGVSLDGSERHIASFIIGGSTVLAPGTLLHFSTSIGLSDDADDFGISLSLPIRFDGRVF